MRIRLTLLFGLGAMALLLPGCGGGQDSSKSSGQPEQELKPTVIVPPPVPQYEGTPYWQTQSAGWPALMEWSLGPTGEYLHDSLFLRITGNVIQSFISGPKGKEHPIMCWFELTVRPIPRKLIGYTFTIDSVNFYDPLKKRTLPSLPMLSSERYAEAGTVRTRFSNNLAILHTPDLVENQPLVPTVYVTGVEKKTIKITMQPMTLTFFREVKPEAIPTDSLKWESGT